MEILALEDLSFRYPGCTENAVDGVSLTVREGEFLLLCGRSGCGKTTLLKLIKRELAPHGELSGNILFRSRPLDSLTDRESAQKIGYVLQSPEAQIVTDKVWHELAFGLESLGCDSDSIRLRVGEMANYFGIDGWFRSGTADLSGGQKQLLNLASVMAMSPELLILDEPTSQLDPIAAQNFIADDQIRHGEQHDPHRAGHRDELRDQQQHDRDADPDQHFFLFLRHGEAHPFLLI